MFLHRYERMPWWTEELYCCFGCLYVALYFNHLQPQSTCEEFEWGSFLVGSNSLNTDCSCHAHSVISNQAVLSCSITTVETLVWWVEIVSRCRRHGEPWSASSYSVSTNQSINSIVASVTLVNVWMFGWWCRKEMWHHSVHQPCYCPWIINKWLWNLNIKPK